MTRSEAWTAIRSDRCQCGTGKRPGMAFCICCYDSMPRELRMAISFSRVGKDFEATYERALEVLRGN